MHELIRRSASNERLAQEAIHDKEMKLVEAKADHQAESSKLMQECEKVKARNEKLEESHAAEVSLRPRFQQIADLWSRYKPTRIRLHSKKQRTRKQRLHYKNSSLNCAPRMQSSEPISSKRKPPSFHRHLVYRHTLRISTLHLFLCAALTLVPAHDPACRVHRVVS